MFKDGSLLRMMTRIRIHKADTATVRLEARPNFY
jgi:hypothetical protein